MNRRSVFSAGISGIGEDPLNIDKLDHKMLMLTAGVGAQSGERD